MVKVRSFSICFMLMGVVLIPALDGWAASAGEATLSPYFFIENGDPSVDQFPLKDTDVVVNINGVIADVVITQKYANSGNRPINARYIFPASTRASVHGMKMIIGEEVINAKISSRDCCCLKVKMKIFFC